MIYINNKDGKPLMPTNRGGRIRWLLKTGQAKVIRAKPFTVQLLYDTPVQVQPITLGIDTGYLNVGFNAISNKKEILSGVLQLMKGMKDRLEKRAMYRKIRRSRLRYRKARFNRTKPKGWLAPSIEHKLNSHIKFIDMICQLLPITKINVEVGNFDIQKIENPEISGTGYQQGQMYSYENTKAFVLARDKYKCQNPNCIKQGNVLHVHHIVYRSKGGTDRPDNLITLCSKCHTAKNHKSGFLVDWMKEGVKLKSYKSATFMNIMKPQLISRLNSKYPDISITYGYITKAKIMQLELTKEHYHDAFVIAGGDNFTSRINPIIYAQKRRNDRSLSTWTDARYIDIRDGKTVTANELGSGRTRRNKQSKENGPNLRKFRGRKISKGCIKKQSQKYFRIQAGYEFEYCGLRHRVTSNVGKTDSIRYLDRLGNKKEVKCNNVRVVRYTKGIICN